IWLASGQSTTSTRGVRDRSTPPSTRRGITSIAYGLVARSTRRSLSARISGCRIASSRFLSPLSPNASLRIATRSSDPSAAIARSPKAAPDRASPPPLAPGPRQLVRDLVGVGHVRAEPREQRRDRALAAADAARESDGEGLHMNWLRYARVSCGPQKSATIPAAPR